MKKILILTSYCYEAARANGLCARALFNELALHDCSVYMIGYGEGENVISSENKYYYIPYPEKHDAAAFADKLKILRVPYTDNKVEDGYFELCRKLHNQICFDMVIAVYFPLEAVCASVRLKKMFPDIELIIYELDSKGDGIQTKTLPGLYQKKTTEMWLRRQYRYADRIFVMQSHSEYFKKTFKKAAKEKVSFVDLPLLVDHTGLISEKQNDTTFFIYAGILDERYRSPRNLLDVFFSLKEYKNYRLLFFSRGCEDMLEEAAKKDSRIILNGYVSQSELEKVMMSSDFLINIGNANSNSVPSKLINYISYGKPILHFSMQERDVCNDYLSSYPLAFSFEYGKALNDDINALLDFLDNAKGKILSYGEIEKRYPMNTPLYSAQAILAKGV